MSGTPHQGCRWGRWGLLVWLLQAFPVLALPSHGIRMTTVDGLPSNVVHQIVEDRKGYLWFATGDGLARYDGSGFRIWRMEHGLADNVVRSLALDARDQLWIGTGNGYLQRLSADRQQFARWAGPAVPTVAASPILAIQPMDDGSVWFGTRDAGLFRLDRDHFLRQHLPAAGGGGLPSARVERLVSDPHGGLWIGSAAGLARWQHDRFQTPAMLGASARPVIALGLDSQGRLHSSTAEGSRVRQLPSLQPVSGHRTPARWLGAARRGVAGTGSAMATRCGGRISTAGTTTHSNCPGRTGARCRASGRRSRTGRGGSGCREAARAYGDSVPSGGTSSVSPHRPDPSPVRQAASPRRQTHTHGGHAAARSPVSRRSRVSPPRGGPMHRIRHVPIATWWLKIRRAWCGSSRRRG